MEGLAALLLIVIAFAMILGFGPSLRRIFASGCHRAVAGVFTVIIILLVLAMAIHWMMSNVGNWWHGLNGHPATSNSPAYQSSPSSSTSTTTPPSSEPIVSSPLTPDLHIARRFDYPVGEMDAQGRRSGKGWYVSQDFADTVNPLNAQLSGQHLGEDWLKTGGSFAGEPVRAIASGEVIRSEKNYSLGYVVMIRHTLPTGQDIPYVVAIYGHLSGSDSPSVGAWVQRGDIVGRIARKGENGFSKGGNPWPEHLHFELRADKSRTGVADDTIFIGGRIGYSTNQKGFLNPTDATSKGNAPGGGWIDAHRD